MRTRFGRDSVCALLLAGMLTGCGGAGGVSPTHPGAAAGPATESMASLTSPGGAARHPIARAVFGPWYGSGCPDFGTCGCDGATTLAGEASCQLGHLAASDIPVTTYLFDGTAWSKQSPHGPSTGPCLGADCCAWNLGADLVQQLRSRNVRALLHAWGGCHEREQYQRAYGSLGRSLFGFYLDDGASDTELEGATQSMQSLIPNNWENVAKTYQNGDVTLSDLALATWANVGYVGDLGYDFDGLKEAVSRVLSKAPLLCAPFAEFTGYAYLDPGSPEEEVYRRRLHFGALQPVMAHTPYANADPWSAEYSSDLLDSYRYWAWLHKELVPYFYSYAYRMFENRNRPVVQGGPDPYSLLIGDELYAPIVTRSTTRMDIQLPDGEWLNYWDESQVLSGSLQDFPVPIGREPIFIRQGSLIPLDVERPYTGHGSGESAGSLTVLVFPSGDSSFRYRPSADEAWVTF